MGYNEDFLQKGCYLAANVRQMSEKGKALIFFTDTFPFGRGEAFIENEFPYLYEAFDKVIVVTNNLNETFKRHIPDNVVIVRYPYPASTLTKAKAVASYFSSTIQNEIKFAQQQLKLPVNKQLLAIMLGSYAKACETEKLIDNLIATHATNMRVHLYSYWMNDMAISIAMYKMLHPKVKVFSRAHRWDIYMEQQPAGYLPFRTLVLANLDALYSISEDGANYLRALTNNQYNSHIKVARLGTSNNLGKPSTVSTDELVLVSCSNLIPRKRVYMIIEALALLTDKVHWIHIGAGPQLEETKALAKQKLERQQNISYTFKGQMDNSDIISYYANNPVDLFINVSNSEGVPVSIMEANSFSIPAIATNTGGVTEVINAQSGFLINVDSNPSDIAAMISTYARLTEERKQTYRHNAYLTWNERYNAHKNYTTFAAEIAAT